MERLSYLNRRKKHKQLDKKRIASPSPQGINFRRISTFGKAWRFSGEMPQLAARAQVEIFPQHPFRQCHRRQFLRWLRSIRQASAESQTLFFAPGRKTAIVADFSETSRQDMKQEPANKLLGIQRHPLHLIAMGVVTPAKSNLTISHR